MTNESSETCCSKTVLKIISTHTQPIYGSKPSTAPPQPPSSAPRNVKVTWSMSRQKHGFKSLPLNWILRLPAISEWRSWNNFHYTTHPQDALSQLSTRETNGVGSHSGPKKPELSPKPRDVSPKPEVIFFDHRVKIQVSMSCLSSGPASEKTSSTTWWLCWFCKPSQSGDLLC